ncbi:VanW family protein [Candidatus Peregrinibacteria bacterium]|nr:VanW family protein [Candidatus Peregrinibacteria bacterium]
MRNIKLSIIMGAAIGVTLAVIISYTRISMHGRYVAGASVLGLDVSYKTKEEVESTLFPLVDEYLDSGIEIGYAGKTGRTTPRELGVKIFVSETLDSLDKIDSRKTGIFELIFPAILGSKNQGMVVRIDRENIRDVLNEKLELDKLAPAPAEIVFEKNGKLSVVEGKKGLAVKMEKLTADLKESAGDLSPVDIVITFEEQNPAITGAALEAQIGEIKAQLDHKFTLLDPVYSDNWDLKLANYVEWVNFVPKQKITIPYLDKTVFIEPGGGRAGDTQIAIEINQDKLNEFVDLKISKWLDRPPLDVKIYRAEKGDVVIEGQGDNGLKVNRKQLKQAIELALVNRIKDIPIPVMEIPPSLDIASDLRDLGIKERIGIGHTSYYRSPPNRVHNIKVGASKFNGKLIAPGETFSFNKNLGRVDNATGYKKELVIKKEGTLPDFGGGICQVSTTMFRTALFAALPIVERNQHTYAVSYYSQILGHGLDATIFLGGPDLRFTNDTDGHILIQTYVENDYELYIVFYGTPTGRTVKMEGPYISDHRKPGPTLYFDTDELAPGETKQIEKEHAGFKALWYRHITDKDGITATEEIRTNYAAVPNKILVGKP